MKNLQIAKIFYNIADILELQDIQFKPQAYRKAAQEIESLAEDIEDIQKRKELENIPGIGEHLAKKVEEIIQTGKLEYYDKLKKDVKVDIEALSLIPGLGPKKIKLLYQKLHIKTIKDLEKAIQQNKLLKLPGFGSETQDGILRGITFLRTKPNRRYYIHAQVIVNDVITRLTKFSFVNKIEVAGSFRRGKETVGDLDFLVISKDPDKVINIFAKLPDVETILAKGSTKCSVRLTNGLQMDLRVLKEKEFGSAMNYFIGSKEHNVELRKLALKKGYSLSEYGLFKLGKDDKTWVAGKTEQDIYKKLGLQFVPPEMRENMGEIQAAQKKLPKLVTVKDINGIFHNHTVWSDGANSLLQMAQAAEELKLKFISFNDHFGPMTIANSMDDKRLTKYIQEIEKIRKKVGIRVFSGVEVDILKDGSLPLPAKRFKELDVVVASVHLAIKMKEAEMTKRVLKAMNSYPLNILGHPTDRLLNERPELNLNMNKVFETAKERGIFLEINSAPKRMDLHGGYIKQALDRGNKFALSTDGHDVSHLPFYKLGVLSARRGWLERKDLLNCWTLPKIEKALQ
jgi:DNA polymerase (family X)